MNLTGGDTDSMKRSTAEGDRPVPCASVIIPTLNRRDMLKRVIDRVLNQSVPGEVFVIDDGSTHGTCEMVGEELPHVRLFPAVPGEGPKGPTYRRNLGARHAAAPVLVMLDDDYRLTCRTTISRTLAGFGHPRVGR